MLNTPKEISIDQASELFYQQMVWFDLEIDPVSNQFQIGGLLGIIEDEYYTVKFNEPALKSIVNILHNAKYVGGHNILQFDLPWLAVFTGAHAILDSIKSNKTIDTLILSSLILPHRPSHALLKIYKTKNITTNDPCYDALESYQIYLDLCKYWGKFTHPQIVKWIQQKNPQWGFLPNPTATKSYSPYLTLIKNGDVTKLFEYIDRILDDKEKEWVGAIAFAHWLLHLDEPSCRRPAWLLDISEYGAGFIKAEKIFWGNQQFQAIDFNLESQDIFGYSLREGQEKIIQTLAQGKSVPVGLLPTGGGKSLTFQLPAFVLSRYRRELTVVISPLKALMEDQVLGLQQLQPWGSRAACLISGQNTGEQRRILEEIWQGNIDLLYVSPERLRTHSIQALLQRRRPALWVVDEAHTFSQWGTDFRPDFMRIGQSIAKCYAYAEEGTRPQLMLVTATASQRVLQEIEKEVIKPLQTLLQVPMQTVMMEPTQNVWRDEIEIDIREVPRDDRLVEIVKILKQVFPQRTAGESVSVEDLDLSHPVVLIYVRNRDKTEEFAEDLAHQGFLTAAYHSRLTGTQKKEVLERFKQHQLDVVICTNAFGMGIDRAMIHTVIHYSPPNNLESYLQEIGRAARKKGEQGQAILFWSKQDLESLVRKNIASELGGHKVLADCWQHVILPTLKRPPEERWFTSQELQPYLSFEDDALLTQIRVLLLALERYGVLVEKDQLPALLSLQLLDPPQVHSTRAADLYRRLAPLLVNQTQQVQLYLPEISVALGMNVRQLLNGVRHLVKLGCAHWSCEVRIRFTHRYTYTQRKIREKYQALEAISECWDNYPPEDVTRIDLRQLDTWFSQRSYRVKAREIFYIFKVFKLVNLKENKYSLRVESRDNTHSWQDWLKHARQLLDQLQQSFDLLQQRLPDDVSTSHQLNVDEFLEQYDIEVETFLEHLEMMQRFAWLNVSRLDDETQKIFFIDLAEGQKHAGRLHSNVAYRYLEQHYQDRNRRLHLMNAWLQQLPAQRKAMLNDYFNLEIQEVCQRYLEDPDQAKQAHLVNYEVLIFPDYLNDIQRKIIADDERRAMLVLAGPGSGKTTIIVHRVANLVMLRNIDPEKILVLAYNRQAVFEIRQRLTNLIGLDYAFRIHIFTFHGLARHLTNIHENQAPAHKDLDYKYQWLLEQAVADLKDTPQYFQYILVDEFQDIDDVQYQLISHLAGMQRAEDDEDEISQRGFLVAVGDDDQNLYGFRGANIKHIQNFKNDYEISEEDVFYLLNNYRSPKDIISLANQYIQHSLPQTQRLKSPEHSIRANNPSIGNIRFGYYQQQHGLDSIQWLVKDLKLRFTEQQKNASPGQTACWSNFAILARQWSELLVVQHALTEAGILFQLLNKNDSLDLAESFFAKHLFAALEARPALEIIEGNAVAYVDQWLKEQEWNRQDLSCHILKQRVAGYQNLSCQQMLDLLRVATEQNRTDRVILSTYHSAKGCEYEHVYIYDQWRSQGQDDPESQIRAMYVALTRPKQSLTLIQPVDHRWKHQYDIHIRSHLDQMDIAPLQFKAAPVIQEISYFEQFGLADMYLSYPAIVQDKGRKHILDIAQDQHFSLPNQVSLRIKLKYDQTFERLELVTQNGVIGAFSNSTSERLYRMKEQVSEVTCVGMQIINYYQADKKFYKNANYHGKEESHYVFIPMLKIRRML
ncbi:RecQ family ATP-dependent DNA helicase [Acinetobacter sp. ABJ_C5_2]|uniref:RecQ family ATP-dependent DNA helicase n=1 Tax=Acinetobacter sp. ABJ_C5_2 TaxID=3376992 RepID=UPI0037C71611